MSAFALTPSYVFAALTLFMVSATAVADGVYDGVWLGTETVTVTGLGTQSDVTWTIVYQDGATRLYAARQDFSDLDQLTAMPLTGSGANWRLTQPITGVVFGVDVLIESFNLTFLTTTRLTGQYGFQLDTGSAVYAGTGSLSHDKLACTSLTSSTTTLTGLSGNVSSVVTDNVKCYRLELPACTSNFRVSTTGGSGDVDLHLAYGQPDFDYSSSTGRSNTEVLTPAGQPGIWYIGLEAVESYSGVTFQAGYTIPDSDGDGVADCDDVCPATPAGKVVDVTGCPVTPPVNEAAVIMTIVPSLLEDQ